MKNNPTTFIAQKWLEGMERIFEAMKCLEEQKVALGIHVIHEEVAYWWKNAKQRIGASGVVITWEMFKMEYLVKYFPEDVKNRTVIEFMELK
jgi:hypothetical protein